MREYKDIYDPSTVSPSLSLLLSLSPNIQKCDVPECFLLLLIVGSNVPQARLLLLSSERNTDLLKYIGINIRT